MPIPRHRSPQATMTDALSRRSMALAMLGAAITTMTVAPGNAIAQSTKPRGEKSPAERTPSPEQRPKAEPSEPSDGKAPSGETAPEDDAEAERDPGAPFPGGCPTNDRKLELIV